MDEFKLKLLLASLRITCRYFQDDEQVCELSVLHWQEDVDDCHIACNCNGDINHCDLPKKFQAYL